MATATVGVNRAPHPCLLLPRPPLSPPASLPPLTLHAVDALFRYMSSPSSIKGVAVLDSSKREAQRRQGWVDPAPSMAKTRLQRGGPDLAMVTSSDYEDLAWMPDLMAETQEVTESGRRWAREWLHPWGPMGCSSKWWWQAKSARSEVAPPNTV